MRHLECRREIPFGNKKFTSFEAIWRWSIFGGGIYNKLGLNLSGQKYVRKEAGKADLGFLGGENTFKFSEGMKPLREYDNILHI